MTASLEFILNLTSHVDITRIAYVKPVSISVTSNNMHTQKKYIQAKGWGARRLIRSFSYVLGN